MGQPTLDTTKNAESLAWLRLFRTSGVGVQTFDALLTHFGSAQNALDNLTDFSRQKGRKTPLTPYSLSAAEDEYAALIKLGGTLITRHDALYPHALSFIPDAPPVLSCLGDLALLHKTCVALVGSRNASMNGKRFAEKLASDLGTGGICVVSGLARGIDRHAHLGALKTGTIGVVAGGVDGLYPPENRDLYEKMRQDGLILSENPLGSEPKAQDFPRRNRIVSGLSAGVVVVEAALQSGSLITARLAAEQGRDVFAVPGFPLDPRSAGTNRLIRDGAILIENADQIIEQIQHFQPVKAVITAPNSVAPSLFDDTPAASAPMPKKQKEPQADMTLAAQIINALKGDAVSVDELVRDLGAPLHDVLTTLLDLELEGAVERHPGNKIARKF